MRLKMGSGILTTNGYVYDLFSNCKLCRQAPQFDFLLVLVVFSFGDKVATLKAAVIAHILTLTVLPYDGVATNFEGRENFLESI